MRFHWVAGLLFAAFLSGCASEANYAPVADITTIQPIPNSGVHIVKRGESIYEVAWRYGLDYRTLAEMNNLKSPYHLKARTALVLKPRPVVVAIKSQPVPAHIVSKTKVLQAKPPIVKVDREPDYRITTWRWPANGKVIRYFSNQNNGIAIAGKLGDPIYAAMSGKVVYAGDGIRGYGNLIIIKHNSAYLSAYANCERLLVHEGAWVKQGQLIAKLGNSGVKQAQLHFEIRRAGVPINPIKVL